MEYPVSSDFGAVYVAIGNQYFRAAMVSSIAFRDLNPNVPVTLFTDTDFSDCLKRLFKISEIELVNIDPGLGQFNSRRVKLKTGELSPYELTLYLDADILPLKPIDGILKYLDSTDLAMVRDRVPTLFDCDFADREQVRSALSQGVPFDAIQYNTGVLLWRRSEQTKGFFKQWMTQWEAFQKQDQVALTCALWSAKLPVSEMPIIYNYPPLDFELQPMPDRDDVKLLHCWGGQVASGEFFDRARRQTAFAMDIVDRIESLDRSSSIG